MSEIGKSTAATPKAPVPDTPTQPRQTAVPREQVRQDGLAKRFTARLECAAENGPDRGERNPAAAAEGRSGHPRRAFEEREGETGQGRSENAVTLTNAARPQGALAIAGPAADTAAIDRMAAQIAEPRGFDTREMEIKFPAGMLAAEASIQRQPDGGLAIRLAGLDPRLGAVREGQARLALLGALEKRRLKVSSLVFERGAGQAGRKSTMSRVV